MRGQKEPRAGDKSDAGRRGIFGRLLLNGFKTWDWRIRSALF